MLSVLRPFAGPLPPALIWVGLAVLGLSVVLAILLARSLLALTRASEEPARGDGRSDLQTRALIANVSHDLKTPLTSILGFAQALRDGAASGPEEVRELSAIIHEEAERIFATVEDLLFLSQLEAGEIALRQADVDLDEVAVRCLRRVDPALSERQISVEARLESGLRVPGDSGKIERVLDNLLDNARKYTPDGGRIILTARAAASDPPTAELIVFNSSSYIRPDELERVFDRFYRTDRSRVSSTGGTGLGLAIVKDLVLLHRGAIQARSVKGDGTAFEVHLPLASPPPPPLGVAGLVPRNELPGRQPVRKAI